MGFEEDSSTASEDGVNETVAMELATDGTFQNGIQNDDLQPLNLPENLEGKKAGQIQINFPMTSAKPCARLHFA